MTRTLKVTINGTGFAGDYTARCYDLIPHQNGLEIELAGITSGQLANAETFASTHDVQGAYSNHQQMLEDVGSVDIDNIACANYAHGPYTQEAAQAGVGVIVLEKPPVVWPGYANGKQADAETRKRESMDYLAEVLDVVRAQGSKLLYAEDFVYFDGVKGLVELLIEAQQVGKGKVLYQQGVCAHPGSHAPAYDTPEKSGGGALFNKACHPLGPCLYLKQVEGILRDGRPIRPQKVSALATQILKDQPPEVGEHFRVMQNVDDFGRITVVFEDNTIAEVVGYDICISGIYNALSVTCDFAQYDLKVNPNDEHQLFMPSGNTAGNILLREKLPTAQGTSFPRPKQFHAHGYVNEMHDAVLCAVQDDRFPQSGALMAWDTMAVLMAGYESAEKGCQFVELDEYLQREFNANEMPDPHKFGTVFQRT